MTERELERRLQAAAVALGAEAPAFDRARLRKPRHRRIRRSVVIIACVVGLVCAVAAPVGISAFRGLFDVDEVPALTPREPGVAPPYAGRTVDIETLRYTVPFGVRMITSLGSADEARVRDDISGGMVTVVYRDEGVLLTQWRTTDVQSRIALIPDAGRAEDVRVGPHPGLWTEGSARGTFTLIGADGTTHRERFQVRSGALLWHAGAMSFLLQGAGSKEDAIRLAAGVSLRRP
jgi:hypothetical protein